MHMQYRREANLAHETWDDAMERNALVVQRLAGRLPNTSLPSAQLAEIFSCLHVQRRQIKSAF